MRPPPPHAFVNKLVVLTLALLIFAGTLGLGAVWARQVTFQTANRSRVLEVKIADIERRLDEVNAEVATALNPDALLRQNKVMRLGLAVPAESQVARVGLAPETLLATRRNRDVFNLATASVEDRPAVRFINASLR
jgi:methyl coenzyme M reductase subunit C